MRWDLVGSFVGFHVGKFRLPDEGQPCGMMSLAGNCRVCRVFAGVESAKEIAIDSTVHDRTQMIPHDTRSGS